MSATKAHANVPVPPLPEGALRAGNGGVLIMHGLDVLGGGLLTDNCAGSPGQLSEVWTLADLAQPLATAIAMSQWGPGRECQLTLVPADVVPAVRSTLDRLAARATNATAQANARRLGALDAVQAVVAELRRK